MKGNIYVSIFIQQPIKTQALHQLHEFNFCSISWTNLLKRPTPESLCSQFNNPVTLIRYPPDKLLPIHILRYTHFDPKMLGMVWFIYPVFFLLKSDCNNAENQDIFQHVINSNHFLLQNVISPAKNQTSFIAFLCSEIAGASQVIRFFPPKIKSTIYIWQGINPSDDISLVVQSSKSSGKNYWKAPKWLWTHCPRFFPSPPKIKHCQFTIGYSQILSSWQNDVL